MNLKNMLKQPNRATLCTRNDIMERLNFGMLKIIQIIVYNNNRQQKVSNWVGAGAKDARVARGEAATGGSLLASGGTKTHVIAGPLVSGKQLTPP